MNPLKFFLYQKDRDFIWPFDQSPGHALLDERGQFTAPELFSRVDQPDEADFFLFPYHISMAIEVVGVQNVARLLRRLPHFARYEARHVFVVAHDDSRPFSFNSVIIRTGVNTLCQDPHTLPLPYTAEDFSHLAGANFTHLPYDTSFVGFTGITPLRQVVVDSVAATPGLASFLKLRPIFYAHVKEFGGGQAQQTQYRAEFLDSLAQARTVLCPRGEGEGSVRLYEAMSAGRVPVLLADAYALPFAGHIDYDAFICRIPQTQAAQTGPILAEWLAGQSPDALQAKGRLARQAWETYLDPARWPQRLYEALQTHRHTVDTATIESGVPAEAGLPLPVALTNRAGKLTVYGVEGGLLPSALVELGRHAAALPQNSTSVVIGAPAAAMAMAAGLQAAGRAGVRQVCVHNWPYAGLELFVRQVQHAGLADIIRPLRMDFLAAADHFPVRTVDFIFVGRDAVVEDWGAFLQAWYPKIRYGGLITGQDPTRGQGAIQRLKHLAGEAGLSYTVTAGGLFELERVAQSQLKIWLNEAAAQPAPEILLWLANDLDAEGGAVLHPAALLADALACGSQYVALRSTDTLAAADWLERLHAVARSNPAIAVVGPAANAAPAGQQIEADYTTFAGAAALAAALAKQHGHSWDEAAYLGGFCLLINSQAAQQVGGLKPNLPLAEALGDLYSRLTRGGFKLARARGVYVHHNQLTPQEGLHYGRESAAEALLAAGRAAQAQGDAPEAARILARLVEQYPDYLPGYSAWGAALLESGQLDEAIKIMRQAAERFPHDAAGHCRLGQTLVNAGRLAEAEAAFQAGLQYHPANLDLLKNLADLYQRRQMHHQALGPLKKALEIVPKDVDLLLSFGLCLAQSGAFDLALLALRQVKALAPATAGVTDLITEFEGVLARG
jgi:tetratricopeptide (TPR) repeat protein